MMKCSIYANGGLIGTAEFVAFDPGMGVALAPFQPTQAYSQIQPFICQFSMMLFDGLSDDELAEPRRKYRALNMTAITEAGEVLNPVGGIDLTDYSAELKTDDDAIEVTLLGLSRETSEKYFQESIKRYRGETA